MQKLGIKYILAGRTLVQAVHVLGRYFECDILEGLHSALVTEQRRVQDLEKVKRSHRTRCVCARDLFTAAFLFVFQVYVEKQEEVTVHGKEKGSARAQNDLELLDLSLFRVKARVYAVEAVTVRGLGGVFV